MLENVKGLVNHNKARTFRLILEALSNLGYKVKHKLLNAKNFGLPQNRERIYIVGFKNHNINFSFPKPLNVQTKLKDILLENVHDKYTISDRLWESHQVRKQKNREKGNGFGYSIFDENAQYTSTLSARYYKDGSEILIKQDFKNPRKLSPRKCARLQGYSDDFKIVVSDNQAYKQFGNSVAVPVIKAITLKIVEILELE